MGQTAPREACWKKLTICTADLAGSYCRRSIKGPPGSVVEARHPNGGDLAPRHEPGTLPGSCH